MTDKSKRRAKEYARQHGISHQAAVNHLRPLHAVLNASEREVELRLERVAAQHGARVYSKIRFADVAKIEQSGLSDAEYRYALQAHLDFVVADEARQPVFAVEFDGPGHDSRRDALKNALCAKFGLPLARVEPRHMNIAALGLHAVVWLAELEFTYRAMEKAQSEGAIPYDEPIDPFSIYRWERTSERFPLSFAMHTSARVQRAYEARRIAVPHVFRVAFGEEGRATAMATLRVQRERFLAVRESIFLSGFGVSPAEAAEELAMAQVGAMLSAYLEGHDVSFAGSAVYERLKETEASGAFRFGGGCMTDPEDFSFVHASSGGKSTTRILPPRSWSTAEPN